MIKGKTFYEVLGVNADATEEEIKRSYRELIKLWHPDLHPDDVEAEIKTREINEAYEVLSDPDKKARYDEMLSLINDPGPSDVPKWETTWESYNDQYEDKTQNDHKFNERAYQEYKYRNEAGGARKGKDPILKIIGAMFFVLIILAIALCVCFYFAGIEIPSGEVLLLLIILPASLLFIVFLHVKNGE